MRAADQIKEHRSYVVHHSANGVEVKGSHWAVGYSPEYRATELEAIDFAIQAAEERMLGAQAAVIELQDYRATFLAMKE